MSQSSSPQLPNHGGSSDSLDAVILYIDVPSDPPPLGKARPAVRKLLAEERAKIMKWHPEWLQMGKKDKEPDKPK